MTLPRLGLRAGLGLAGLGYAAVVVASRALWVADPPVGELEAELDRWLAEAGLRVRHRYLHTTVGRVHLLDSSGAGAPVLLVPGLAASGGELGPLIARLAEGRRVLALDRPGTGLSDPVRFRGHPRTAWVQLLSEVGEQLELERLTLVGHSLGGLAAGAYATVHPERVARLVLVSPFGLESRIAAHWNLALVPGSVELLGASARAGAAVPQPHPAVPDPSGASGPAGLAGDTPRQRYLRGVALRFGPGSDLSTVPRLFQPLRLRPESMLLPGLGLLSGRTLVIWGGEDRRLSLAGARRSLRHYPGLRLEVVEGAGHLLPFERPGLLASLIVEA